jgi:hypothetical protein
MQKSKEEMERMYLEAKLQLSLLADDVPLEIKERINQNLQVVHNALYVIIPAGNDLAIALKKLSFTKYPEFNDNSIPHLGELVSQVCATVANTIVKNTNAFLVDVESNNTSYIDDEEQFQNLVTFFSSPLEESEESEDATETSSRHTINNEKKEFLGIIMEVLFRYFEESLNNLDAKGWQLIGISLGHTFLVYIKRCYVLMGGLAEGIIIENPGISYKDLEKKLSESLPASPENEWMLKLE